LAVPIVINPDAATFVVWACVNLLLLTGAWRLSRRLAPSASLTGLALQTTILSWAGIIATETVLGIANLLVPSACMAIVAVVGALLHWFSGKATLRPERDASGLVLWVAVLAIWSPHIVSKCLLKFPTDWDTIMYHIPLVDQWLQVKGLFAPREAFWYYPGNNELMGFWYVAPFSGDFFIGLNNIGSFTVLLLGTIELGATLNLSRTFTLWLGLTSVANYVVFRQITDSENDIAVAALFFAGLNYSLQHVKSRTIGDLVLTAITVGLLTGVKYYALGYGFVIGVVTVLGTWQTGGLRNALRALVAITVGAFLLGGYWYARNTWITGTPIFPKGFTASTDVMSQVPTWKIGMWPTTLIGCEWPDAFELTGAAIWRWAGPCYFVGVAGLPLTLVLVIVGVGFSESDWVNQETPRTMVVFAVFATGIIWLITPWAARDYAQLERGYQAVRFGLPFFGICNLGLAVAVQDLVFCCRRVNLRGIARGFRGSVFPTVGVFALVCMVGGTLYQLISQTILVSPESRANVDDIEAAFYRFLIGFNVLLAGAVIAGTVGFRWLVWRWWGGAGAMLLLVSGLAQATSLLGDRWHNDYVAFYDQMLGDDICSRVAQNDPAVTHVASLFHHYYPFFGSHRQFSVARPHWLLSKTDLEEYMATHEVTVVIAINHDPTRTQFHREPVNWVNQLPGVFRKTYVGDMFSVYDVEQAELKKRR